MNEVDRRMRELIKEVFYDELKYTDDKLFEYAVDNIMNRPEIEHYKPEIIRQIRDEKLKRIMNDENI